MSRNAELLELLDAEAEQYAIWVDADADAPAADYWMAVDALLDAFEADPGTGPMARAQPRVDQWRAAYDEFNEGGAAMPGSKFWRLRGEVQDACRQQPPQLAPLDSVAELDRQKVPHYQIARIWRLLDEAGQDRVDLVQQELAQPGSVITPEHIAHVDSLRMVEAGWGPDEAQAKPPKPKPVKAPPRPASLEELIEQRVPVSQIVSIKQGQYGADFPATIVATLAAAMSIELPGSADAVINQAAAQLTKDVTGIEPQAPEAVPPLVEGEIVTPVESLPDDEGASVDEQIIQLHEDGHDTKTIAQHVGLSEKKVRSIVRKWAERPEVSVEGI